MPEFPKLKISLNPLSSAPRDGTEILIVEGGQHYGPGVIRARVCLWWVTDEFVPSHVPYGDSEGADGQSIHDSHILGWLPLDRGQELLKARDEVLTRIRDTKKLIADALRGGERVKAICEQFNCEKRTVWLIARDYGIELHAGDAP